MCHLFDRKIFLCMVIVMVLLEGSCLNSVSIAAQDQLTVSSCYNQSSIPVIFQIDCSNLKDDATKDFCKPFIENQACKVFPAYRKITGIKLENKCKSIKYKIYEEYN